MQPGGADSHKANRWLNETNEILRDRTSNLGHLPGLDAGPTVGAVVGPEPEMRGQWRPRTSSYHQSYIPPPEMARALTDCWPFFVFLKVPVIWERVRQWERSHRAAICRGDGDHRLLGASCLLWSAARGHLRFKRAVNLNWFRIEYSLDSALVRIKYASYLGFQRTYLQTMVLNLYVVNV